MADPDRVKERLEAIGRHLGAQHYHATRRPAHDERTPARGAADRGDAATSPRVARPPLWVREVLVHDRTAWVLEDEAGILEVADSLDTLTADHPHATIIATRPPDPEKCLRGGRAG